MRNTYSKDFKAEALVLAQELGVAKAAERLGMSQCTLSKWRQNAKKQLGGEQAVKENEYDKLAKEVVELRKANEILKAALGFFAIDRRRL